MTFLLIWQLACLLSYIWAYSSCVLQSKSRVVKKISLFFIYPYVFSFSTINNFSHDMRQQLNFTAINFSIKPIKFGIPSHLAIGSSPFLNWGIQFMCSAIKVRSCKLQFLCWSFPPIIGDIICLVQQKYNSLTNIVANPFVDSIPLVIGAIILGQSKK